MHFQSCPTPCECALHLHVDAYDRYRLRQGDRSADDRLARDAIDPQDHAGRICFPTEIMNGELWLRMWSFHFRNGRPLARSEEHTSELQSLMRISYAVFCLKKKNT